MSSLVLLLALGCAGSEEAAAPPPEDKCPQVSMDALAGDWIKVQGSTGDHTYRLRVFQEGGAWKAWYVGGSFKKVLMDGEVRGEELVLTQVMSAEDEAQWRSGAAERTRLYFQPHKPRCAVRVVDVALQPDDKEKQRHTGYIEYLPFPPGQEFTYRPCDEPLFLGDAAADKAKADAQLEEMGEPDPNGVLGEKVPAGTWSVAADDGDESCTYDMDLFFDDRPVEGGQAVPAAAVEGEHRRWYHEWYAPYSGNHGFEAYRYRTCDGGARELIAVACVSAILN